MRHGLRRAVSFTRRGSERTRQRSSFVVIVNVVIIGIIMTVKTAEEEKRFYPLGENIFASVKTWRGSVKVYLRAYKTNTKGGRLVPKAGGLSLNLGQFRRLVKAKKHLVTELLAQQQQKTATVLPAESLSVKNPVPTPSPFPTATRSTTASSASSTLLVPTLSTPPQPRPCAPVLPTPPTLWEADNSFIEVPSSVYEIVQRRQRPGYLGGIPTSDNSSDIVKTAAEHTGVYEDSNLQSVDTDSTDPGNLPLYSFANSYYAPSHSVM